jgi:hypothetical protein
MAACCAATYIGLARMCFVRRTIPNDVLSEGLASLPVSPGGFFIVLQEMVWLTPEVPFPARRV